MAVVLVTGGSSGIGLATVRRLAAAGHRVFAASRDPARSPLPAGVSPLGFDIAQPAAAALTVAAVVDAAGALDVVVNNAGIGAIRPMEETSDDEAHHIMEVNLFGPLRLARAAIPVMRAAGGGRIINVTSLNDSLPAPFGGWYSASKAALASASVALDAEVHGFGIMVTVVAPGFHRTAMSASLGDADVPAGSPYEGALRRLRDLNAGRLATAADPDDVAVAVERCIDAAEPPARVVVGADAAEMTTRLRDATPEDLAAWARGFVEQLTSGREGEGV